MPKKIMVVDDEENILILVEGLLKENGFEVVTAKTGDECLKLVHKEKPDLLLLDIMMPEMSGIRVAEEIRADPKVKDIKIAFLTVVMSHELSSNRLKKVKAIDYIKKPFNNEELIERIKKIL